MCRHDSFLEKIEKLIRNSTRYIIGDELGEYTEKCLNLIQFFKNEKLYILDNPTQIIRTPHLIKSNDLPKDRVVVTEIRFYEDYYQSLSHLNNELRNGSEIYLFSSFKYGESHCLRLFSQPFTYWGDLEEDNLFFKKTLTKHKLDGDT